MMKISKWQLMGTGSLALVLALAAGPGHAAVPVLNVEDAGVTDKLLTGPTAYRSGYFGARMVNADFNGDGLGDLAISGPSMNSPRGTARVGMVHLFFGGSAINNLPAEFSTEDGRQNVRIYGSSEKERVGEMLAAGDLNGDGYVDLVMVAQTNPNNDGTTTIARMYVVYGRASFPTEMTLPAGADVTIERTKASGVSSTWPSMQVSAITLGDINGDHYDDLVFSDKVNNVFAVKYGSAAKWPANVDMATDADIVLRHSQDTNLYGSNYFPLYNQPEIAGVAVGDLNADGIGDLALGVPNETASGITNAGRVYVLYGKTNFPAQIDIDTVGADSLITGGCIKDKIGGPLVTGDINGDGRTDLLIGEPRSQRCNLNSTGLGQVQILLGKAGGLAASVDLYNQADISLYVSGNGDPDTSVARIGFYTGQEILARDLNGDRIADIIISSPGAFLDNGDNGWVHVVLGSATPKSTYLLDQDADLWLRTPEPTGPRLISGRMGESMAVVDLNADGKKDIIMGAPEGLSTLGGFVPVLLNPFGKLVPDVPPPVIVPPVASANPATGAVIIGQVNTDTLGVLKVYMQFAADGRLDITSYAPVAASHSKPASFVIGTGRLVIPEVQYGTVVVKNVVLQWVPQVRRLAFQLVSYQM